MGSFDQPVLNHGGLVRPIIVENYMDLQTIRDIVLYKVKELAEFNTAMPPVAFAEHFTGCRLRAAKSEVVPYLV
jgi:hypothetical protein